MMEVVENGISALKEPKRVTQIKLLRKSAFLTDKSLNL